MTKKLFCSRCHGKAVSAYRYIDDELQLMLPWQLPARPFVEVLEVPMKPDEKIEKLKSGGAEHRDTQGGTYDVDPALAKDSGQGEFGGQPPEGMSGTEKAR